MPNIMLVDDEPNILNSLRRAITGMPWDAVGEKLSVEAFTSPLSALERAEEHAFDLVISDYRMPDMDGVSFLRRLIELQPDISRLILSGYADLQAIIAAVNTVQIYRFISKPWDDYEMTSSVTGALELRRVVLENRRLADQLRVQQGRLSRNEFELRRLEQKYPGLTRVKRADDGSIDIGFGDET